MDTDNSSELEECMILYHRLHEYKKSLGCTWKHLIKLADITFEKYDRDKDALIPDIIGFGETRYIPPKKRIQKMKNALSKILTHLEHLWNLNSTPNPDLPSKIEKQLTPLESNTQKLQECGYLDCYVRDGDDYGLHACYTAGENEWIPGLTVMMHSDSPPPDNDDVRKLMEEYASRLGVTLPPYDIDVMGRLVYH